MIEARPHPAATPEPPAPSERARLEELRRFHHGDPRARPSPPPTGVLPAALAGWRGREAPGAWPLAVDADAAAGEPFARPVGKASEPDARRIAFGRGAVVELATLAARRRLAAAHAAFAASAHELVAAADALLAADLERRPRETPPEQRLERLGSLGARFFDPERVAAVAERRSSGEPFDPERRRRLQSARARLAGVDVIGGEPLWIVPPSLAVGDLDAPSRTAADPCAVALTAFDELAGALTPLIAAARLVRLEAADAFVAERHLPALERLDASGFEAEELALVPPVLALVRVGDLLAGGRLPSLTRLLLSGRPAHVVVLADESDDAVPGVRFELAYLGVGHREAFVQQASLARPEALIAAFERALAGGRPALHVVETPSEAPADLDPQLVAAARLAGRAAPVFRYEPEAGASWARRLTIADNPEPADDWPREPLPGAGDVGAPFTYADAALLDPARGGAFALADLDSEDLVPLADWLALGPREALGRLPFVVGATLDGARVRLVVSRALAFATRDRLAFWRTLGELAGVRNEHVEEAVASARREAEAHAARERAELAEEHRAELERVRAEAASAVVGRLVAGLLEVDGSRSSG